MLASILIFICLINLTKGYSIWWGARLQSSIKTRRVCTTNFCVAPTFSPAVEETDLQDELKKSFLSYSMSTILGRALPDVRDGLKPVHRRVLYAMHLLGLSPTSSFRKCARIVGEVLGKFHPHGDQSVYDALVRMAQSFVILHPLIDGHGNFGSIDDDPPAAMRYTEAKLSLFAHKVCLDEIKEQTVNFTQNFDGSEMEPMVLPAKLPLLLINGASGIAVGMSTIIPPHNLGEIIDAMVALVDNPHLPDETLLRMVPGPDFPTGGLLLGLDGARKLYLEGRGSVKIRAKTHIEQLSATGGKGKGRTAIVVTELPYLVNKAGLLENMADMVNNKKLDGISDLRDESDRDGVRIVIELKRDAVVQKVLDKLFKRTSLETSVAGNMVALVEEGRSPMKISLRETLLQFINFRRATVRRRTENQLKRVQERDHIVLGLLSALQRVDMIIKIIKQSSDAATARGTLMADPFYFSKEQAEAILGLTLRRLTSLEEKNLSNEHLELTSKIEQLTAMLADERLIAEKIKEESLQLKTEFATKRKTILAE